MGDTANFLNMAVVAEGVLFLLRLVHEWRFTVQSVHRAPGKAVSIMNLVQAAEVR